MRNTQTLTIVLLLTTAVILGALLVGTYTTRRAYADSSAKGGRYVMVCGKIANNRDCLYLINVPAQQLNVYAFDTRTRMVELAFPVDLRQLFSGDANSGEE